MEVVLNKSLAKFPVEIPITLWKSVEIKTFLKKSLVESLQQSQDALLNEFLEVYVEKSPGNFWKNLEQEFLQSFLKKYQKKLRESLVKFLVKNIKEFTGKCLGKSFNKIIEKFSRSILTNKKEILNTSRNAQIRFLEKKTRGIFLRQSKNKLISEISYREAKKRSLRQERILGKLEICMF